MKQSTALCRIRALTIVAFALLPMAIQGCAVEDEPSSDSESEALRWWRHRCVPTTCASLGLTCGSASNGCGGTLDCGACAPPPPASPPPPPPVGGGFTLGMRPFAASSSWNTPIPSNATYTHLSWPASTGYNYWVNWDGYSPAIYQGTSADPLVQVTIPDSWGWPAQTLGIRLPLGATGAVGTDGELLALDGTTVHNCWQFVRTSNTTAKCSAYGRTDVVTGSGWGSKSPFLSAGIVAAGSSQLAGLLVQAETDAGEIAHALQLVVDGVLQKAGAVGEAISSDGGSSTGIVQEGERLALPPSMSMPAGLSPLGQKVFRSMQTYGVFDIDVAGGTTTLRAQANAYSASVIDALRTDANKLTPFLQRVQF